MGKFGGLEASRGDFEAKFEERSMDNDLGEIFGVEILGREVMRDILVTQLK
mgnify:CR=1 FL=1